MIEMIQAIVMLPLLVIMGVLKLLMGIFTLISWIFQTIGLVIDFSINISNGINKIQTKFANFELSDVMGRKRDTQKEINLLENELTLRKFQKLRNSHRTTCKRIDFFSNAEKMNAKYLISLNLELQFIIDNLKVDIKREEKVALFAQASEFAQESSELYFKEFLFGRYKITRNYMSDEPYLVQRECEFILYWIFSMREIALSVEQMNSLSTLSFIAKEGYSMALLLIVRKDEDSHMDYIAKAS